MQRTAAVLKPRDKSLIDRFFQLRRENKQTPIMQLYSLLGEEYKLCESRVRNIIYGIKTDYKIV